MLTQFSCNKDDEISSIPLIGTWQYVEKQEINTPSRWGWIYTEDNKWYQWERIIEYPSPDSGPVWNGDYQMDDEGTYSATNGTVRIVYGGNSFSMEWEVILNQLIIPPDGDLFSKGAVFDRIDLTVEEINQ